MSKPRREYRHSHIGPHTPSSSAKPPPAAATAGASQARGRAPTGAVRLAWQPSPFWRNNTVSKAPVANTWCKHRKEERAGGASSLHSFWLQPSYDNERQGLFRSRCRCSSRCATLVQTGCRLQTLLRERVETGRATARSGSSRRPVSLARSRCRLLLSPCAREAPAASRRAAGRMTGPSAAAVVALQELTLEPALAASHALPLLLPLPGPAGLWRHEDAVSDSDAEHPGGREG